jgi:hypothetical protein
VFGLLWEMSNDDKALFFLSSHHIEHQRRQQKKAHSHIAMTVKEDLRAQKEKFL